MLELSELDNEITKKQLSKTFHNKVDIKFGLDANKIKGVNNFPIHYATDGFTSHAKQNVDSFMFHTPNSTNKYKKFVLIFLINKVHHNQKKRTSV
jgi:hypothetical protein